MSKKPRATDVTSTTSFTLLGVEDLVIEDERSFRHVALYEDLKDVLSRARYPFRVLPRGAADRADRALLLNLTFWNADAGGDVLTRAELAADVVAHAAWHHLAARAFAQEGARPSVDALFFGEAIASAFDVYLVGRLLGRAPEASFLETQVPAMADATDAAGLSEGDFEELLQGIAEDPDRAFEELRQLLFDATRALYDSTSAEEGFRALARFDGHRFAPMLHRYELSNWVLYAHAYAGPREPDPRVRELDEALRASASSVDWLEKHWVTPALR